MANTTVPGSLTIALAVALLTGADVTATAQVGGASAPRAKLLVAHRGASAYAPEHTLEAYRLAIEQGADFVEQDLALTKDGVLICLHDETLERTTDVEERFPDRATAVTANGATTRRWYAADFTLAEIKSLDAGSWFNPKFTGARVPTFQEAIDLVRGKAGIFPELKAPAAYKSRGMAMEPVLAAALTKNGLATRAGATPVILQSFDADSLRTMARLLPEVRRELLVEPFAGDRLLPDAQAVAALATFVTGVAPHKSILQKRPEIVGWAHRAGLTVTPWTFRASGAGAFPDVRTEMADFLYRLGVDALFTDNPDQFPRQAPAR
jgi:glycerophosphoryl diester phosphodiesterase